MQKFQEEGGLEWATVDTHNRGRDVLLSGSAPSEEEKSRAMTVASQLAQDNYGNPVARIVQWQGEVVIPEPEIEPGNLSFSAVDGKITLNGVVSSDEQKLSIINAASSVYGGDNVIDRLTIRDNILPIDNIQSLVENFALDNGTLRLSLDKDLKITGEVNSEQRKTSIGQAFEASLPEGYSVDNQITVVEPETASLSLVSQDGKVILNGIVANEQQKQEIVESTIKNYGARNVIDKITVGNNILPIENAGELIGRFYLTNGSMKLSNNVLSITGEVDSETIKSDIGQKVQSDLSADVSLENLLSIRAPSLAEICQVKVSNLMSESKIYFSVNKAEIKAESFPLLNQIALVLDDCQESTILVAGHTDNTGSDEINQPLSLNRAQAVVEYLISKGIIASRLSSAGYGSEQPIADNATAEGRAVNRRIEFTVK